MSGIWGVLAVGLFAQNPFPLNTTNGRAGVFIGGDWYLLGVQALEATCLGTYSFASTISILWLINKIVPIRMAAHEELVGADLAEHLIMHKGAGVSRAVSALNLVGEHIVETAMTRIVGSNPGHELYLEEYVKRKAQEAGKENNKNSKVFTIMKTGTLKDIPKPAWLD